MPLVSVLMGSESDRSYMQETMDTLEQMGIEGELKVISAHRQPNKLREYISQATANGVELFIAGAGAAAHLPGVIASLTTKPVIGIPLPTSDLKGQDSLYAIVQMPAGVPVATVAIGKAGARNAAYLAAQILGIKYPEIAEKYNEYRRQLAER
ncbi:phosphoribosylaminoimidazole carboxylase, catalytic subunit [Thermobaculum terrenum ATCC BAA-798]|uniref:N5-carboxyaminoimidazole ribonucleotide mutase n=1 Tax=Thermobaculum terrenum (strain ATCC BAA-798 / CCMEE 7001 / YNP1) TaxID=525904 RepID=D1CBZ6_THET1|nr:5-(carboxyamino)imidazole ribonucleotide mutase [Thermobaculum terrenum]ACZ42311.1 phosphoribosylaminoimidazole carboxylase, catalytic subunit [Thermobaculum terrenum ATCC BAA-798]